MVDDGGWLISFVERSRHLKSRVIFLLRLDGFSNVVSQIENNPPSKVLKLGLLLFEIM